MYKVFLVEDESIVREGLRDNIPWGQYGFEFAGEASDGEIALSRIREVRPDVLITDIRMPFMDGLSLCRIVRNELPDIKIIILSGYNDFEYARKAIEVGVERYLTKPVTRKAMAKELAELSEKLDEERHRDDYLFKYREEIREYEQFRVRHFFETVFEGGMSVEQIYSEAGKLGLDISGPVYRLMLIDLFTTDTDAQRRDDERLQNLSRYRDGAEQYLLRHREYIFTQWISNTYCVIIRGDSHTVSVFAEKAVNMVRRNGEKYEGTGHFICLSDEVGRFSQLSECNEQLSRFYICRFMGASEDLVTPENYTSVMEKAGRREARPAAGMMTGAGSGTGHGAAMETGDAEDEAAAISAGLLEKAVSYIDEHFAEENLSLNMAAAALDASPGYLSTLFSQKMNMTFVEYVTYRRIEKAKTILRSTREHTAAVAAMVGYKDPNYFSTVFKKTTGCTPREYRRGY